MRRRGVITGLGGAALAWPLSAPTQQDERKRRIGVLMPLPAEDAGAKAYVAALLRGQLQLGWSDGGNMRIEYRAGAEDADRFRRDAAELVASRPR